MPQQPPSVGRIVHYHTLNNSWPPGAKGRANAALICEVTDAGRVHLAVFNGHGSHSYGAQDVPFKDELSNPPQTHWWEWPPHVAPVEGK